MISRLHSTAGGAERAARAGAIAAWALVCALLWPAFAKAAAPIELTDNPPRETVVDWSQGYIYAWGTSPAPVDARAAAGFNSGLGAAWAEAENKLSRLASELTYDVSRRVGDLLERGGEWRRAQQSFRHFLAAAEPLRVFRRADGSVGLWARAAMYGRGGLAAVTVRKSQEREGLWERGEEPAEAPGGPLLVLRVEKLPATYAPALWPSIYRPGGDKFADLARLSEEGRLPPRFRIFRTDRAGAAADLSLPPADLGLALRARTHENGVDYVLEEEPPEGASDFNPYAWQGLLVIYEEGLPF